MFCIKVNPGTSKWCIYVAAPSSRESSLLLFRLLQNFSSRSSVFPITVPLLLLAFELFHIYCSSFNLNSCQGLLQAFVKTFVKTELENVYLWFYKIIALGSELLWKNSLGFINSCICITHINRWHLNWFTISGA